MVAILAVAAVHSDGGGQGFDDNRGLSCLPADGAGVPSLRAADGLFVCLANHPFDNGQVLRFAVRSYRHVWRRDVDNDREFFASPCLDVKGRVVDLVGKSAADNAVKTFVFEPSIHLDLGRYRGPVDVYHNLGRIGGRGPCFGHRGHDCRQCAAGWLDLECAAVACIACIWLELLPHRSKPFGLDRTAELRPHGL